MPSSLGWTSGGFAVRLLRYEIFVFLWVLSAIHLDDILNFCNIDMGDRLICLIRAAYYGTRIVLRQVSPESESIYDLILLLYSNCQGNWKHYSTVRGVSETSVQDFLEYAAQFLGNLGNYKGFGDVKFIPRCPRQAVETMCEGVDGAKELVAQCVSAGMFVGNGASEASMLFGFPDQGHVSQYYPDSPSITQDAIRMVGEFVAAKGLLPENTRLRKTEAGDYEILIASGVSNPPNLDFTSSEWRQMTISEGPLAGKNIIPRFGDHINEMAKIAANMKKAGQHAANPTQSTMMERYTDSFATGSLLAFKESQRLWVSDIGPQVETNIGFIETYRDPAGIRGEWEGFVAMVNKERTLAFRKLVDAAPSMIPRLPWSSDFEKDTFNAPDFTSLEVLSFCSSGLPAGINIPNYDDIRQTCGFKNVSLGNVLSAKSPNEPVPFIHANDVRVYEENRDAAFEVQVGIHELLGHGTGKLLQETSPGVFNFDVKNPPLSPMTGKPVKTWYKPNETWGSVFGAIASSYEECRAECVAMALACDFSILSIFGFGDGKMDMQGKAGDVLYAAYLSMARAGVVALEHWDPQSGKWGQIHMQARFSILKTFLETGDGFCWLDHKPGGQLQDMTVRLDRSKILSHGRPAVEKYLQELHVYKSTADFEAGKRLYEEKTSVVGEFWGRDVRDEVIRKKTPRKVFVMANTVLGDAGDVTLKEYEATLEGMVQSWAERDV